MREEVFDSIVITVIMIVLCIALGCGTVIRGDPVFPTNYVVTSTNTLSLATTNWVVRVQAKVYKCKRHGIKKDWYWYEGNAYCVECIGVHLGSIITELVKPMTEVNSQ